jgi:hypothetical protein
MEFRQRKCTNFELSVFMNDVNDTYKSIQNTLHSLRDEAMQGRKLFIKPNKE